MANDRSVEERKAVRERVLELRAIQLLNALRDTARLNDTAYHLPSENPQSMEKAAEDGLITEGTNFVNGKASLDSAAFLQKTEEYVRAWNENGWDASKKFKDQSGKMDETRLIAAEEKALSIGLAGDGIRHSLVGKSLPLVPLAQLSATPTVVRRAEEVKENAESPNKLPKRERFSFSKGVAALFKKQSFNASNYVAKGIELSQIAVIKSLHEYKGKFSTKSAFDKDFQDLRRQREAAVDEVLSALTTDNLTLDAVISQLEGLQRKNREITAAANEKFARPALELKNPHEQDPAYHEYEDSGRKTYDKTFELGRLDDMLSKKILELRQEKTISNRAGVNPGDTELPDLRRSGPGSSGKR